jgi:hypothetical protein
MGKVEQITFRNKIMQAIKIGNVKIRVGQEIYLKSGIHTRGVVGPFLLDAILLQPEPIECHFRLSEKQNKESTFVVGFSKLNM